MCVSTSSPPILTLRCRDVSPNASYMIVVLLGSLTGKVTSPTQGLAEVVVYYYPQPLCQKDFGKNRDFSQPGRASSLRDESLLFDTGSL